MDFSLVFIKIHTMGTTTNSWFLSTSLLGVKHTNEGVGVNEFHSKRMKWASNTSQCSFCNTCIIHFPLPYFNIGALLYERETIINTMFATLPVNFHFPLLVFVYTPLKWNSCAMWTLVNYCHIVLHRGWGGEGEGERGKGAQANFFRFLVIVMIRLNSRSTEILLASSTIAQTFSLERLNINYHKRETLCFRFLFLFQLLRVTRNIILTV